MMQEYRNIYLLQVGGMKLAEITDYSISETINIETKEKTPIDVEKQNALKFIMTDTGWYALRPSGTEPKIKIYMNTVGKTRAEAEQKLQAMKTEVINQLQTIE